MLLQGAVNLLQVRRVRHHHQVAECQAQLVDQVSLVLALALLVTPGVVHRVQAPHHFHAHFGQSQAQHEFAGGARYSIGGAGTDLQQAKVKSKAELLKIVPLLS